MAKLKANRTSWDLTLLFKSENDTEIQKLRKITEKKTSQFVKKWKNRDDYLKKPKVLLAALSEYEDWRKNFDPKGGEHYYYSLKTSQDQNAPKLKAKYNKSIEFVKKMQNQIQFFELRLAKIDPRQQSQFLNYKPLMPYKHFLERLFLQAKHLLTEPEEKIMNLKSPVAHDNWTKMTSGFLSKEERMILNEKRRKDKKSFSDILGLMGSRNKRVRNSAANAFNDILASHTDTAEHELNAVLQNKKIDDGLRNYERADTDRHISDDVDTDTVDTLVSSVSSHFDVAMHHYKLKAKLLGVKKLEYHERLVEYGKIEAKYSYKDAVSIIESVYKNLDKDFSNLFSDFVNEGRVDVYPRSGKRSGAFTAYTLLSQPTFLLLNWTNMLKDVLTFAHELGHGINFELVRRKQNALNFGTPGSTAEVASTFMEDFVFQELLKRADKETRLALMVNKLDEDVKTIFRQIALYNFETELHKTFRERGYLSKEEIGKTFQKHMDSYMGPYVLQSPGSENWWVYWRHIRFFFYVYSYAGGLLISKTMQAEVKKDSKFIGAVKEFLSVGLSESPKDSFKKLGIDISKKDFWEKGIAEIETLLKETNALAKNLGKI